MEGFYFEVSQLYYILRMVASALCGFIIGFERRNRFKNAGIRTHCIVALGASLMMLISKYGFFDQVMGELGIRGADSARIASQVVSGIGFLGAGMIFVHKNSISGLTTAAGIWATAGVGMAIGAGMYVIGFSATILLIAVQILLHKNFRWLRMPSLKTLYIQGVSEPDYQVHIKKQLAEIGVTVVDTSVEKDEKCSIRNYAIVIEIPSTIHEDHILDRIQYNCTIKATD